jgi:hypothetical protein
MILLIRRGSFYKAKKLATTAYWDNFEYIEKPLGKELLDTVEQLLRVQLSNKKAAKHHKVK